MNACGPSPAVSSPAAYDASTYEIRVAGHLDDHWSAMLSDLTVTRQAHGTTTLTGPLADQAQLHGVLARIRDLGVPLLSVRALEAEPPAHDANRL